MLWRRHFAFVFCVAFLTTAASIASVRENFLSLLLAEASFLTNLSRRWDIIPRSYGLCSAVSPLLTSNPTSSRRRVCFALGKTVIRARLLLIFEQFAFLGLAGTLFHFNFKRLPLLSHCVKAILLYTRSYGQRELLYPKNLQKTNIVYLGNILFFHV